MMHLQKNVNVMVRNSIFLILFVCSCQNNNYEEYSLCVKSGMDCNEYLLRGYYEESN